MIHIDTRDTSNVQIDALHPALLVLEANTARLGSDTAAVVREAAAAAVKVKHPWKIFLCKISHVHYVLILYKRQGAEATKSMRAQAGRASYVAADKVGGVTFVWVKFRITGLLKEGHIICLLQITEMSHLSLLIVYFQVTNEDPGAVAAAAWFGSIAKILAP